MRKMLTFFPPGHGGHPTTLFQPLGVQKTEYGGHLTTLFDKFSPRRATEKVGRQEFLATQEAAPAVGQKGFAFRSKIASV